MIRVDCAMTILLLHIFLAATYRYYLLNSISFKFVQLFHVGFRFAKTLPCPLCGVVLADVSAALLHICHSLTIPIGTYLGDFWWSNIIFQFERDEKARQDLTLQMHNTYFLSLSKLHLGKIMNPWDPVILILGPWVNLLFFRMQATMLFYFSFF